MTAHTDHEHSLCQEDHVNESGVDLAGRWLLPHCDTCGESMEAPVLYRLADVEGHIISGPMTAAELAAYIAEPVR